MSIGHLYPPAIEAGSPRRFTVDEYRRMAELGILRPGEDVELIGGLVSRRGGSGLRPRRFTIHEYDRLAEAGILRPDERVELIDGVVYCMSPMGSRHAKFVELLTDLFYDLYRARAAVRVQSPIHLPDLSEPEPDLLLLKPRRGRYGRRLPRPEDVLLLVEVMDTSALRDRGQKLTAYAQAGIPEVWLVDLVDRSVEVHTEPTDHVYGRSTVRRPGQDLVPSAFADIPLPVAAVFGDDDEEEVEPPQEAAQ